MKKIGHIKTFTSKEVEKSYVSIDFCCLDRELFDPDKCYDLLSETGVKYARCQSGWNRCEKQKGVYTFEWLDSVIDNLCQRGIEPWLQVGYGNPIYMPDAPNPTAVGCVPLYYGEETLEAWKRFVRLVTERYKKKVKKFEIWNECDLNHFWYPKDPNGAEYAKLINITACEIKNIYPEAEIIGVVAEPKAFAFINDLLDNVNKEYLDYFSYHIYAKVPEFKFGEITHELKKLFKAKGFDRVRFIQGEAGYPSWGYKGHWLVPWGCDDERPQAIFMLRRYFLDIYDGVCMSSFFQMADMWEKPYAKAEEVIQKPAAHGILNGLTYTPKLSYKTITNISAIFSGDIVPSDDYLLVAGLTSSPIDLLSFVKPTFRKNGYPIYAFYYPSDLTKEYKTDNLARLTVLNKISDPVIIDTLSGEVFDTEMVYCDNRVYGTNTYSYDLPIKDYPLVLTDRKVFQITE